MKQKILNHFNGNFRSFYKKYFQKINKSGDNQFITICPFHPDTNPSFSFNNSDGRYYCHGCHEKGDIFNFYSKKNDLHIKHDFKNISEGICNDFGISFDKQELQIVSTYDYTDEKGILLYQVVREKPKGFKQRRPIGNNKWVYNLKEVRRVLYKLPDIIASKEVLIVEGEKDVDKLSKLGFTATTSPMGAGKWKDDYNKYMKNKDVVLIPDNDEEGRNHMEDVGKSLHGKVKSLKILELPDLQNKGDISDFIATFNDTETAKERLSIIIDNAEPFKLTQSNKPLTSFTAADLIKMELPEPKWAIEGILSEGLNILGGKPKQGKSIFALNIAISIASGSKVLGKIDVKSGDVLYLALEDTARRLQSRLKTMLQANEAPNNLFIETKWPKIDEDNLEKLDEKMKEIPNLRLVIIDTLKKIKSGKNAKNKTLYDIDYDLISSIKDIADKRNVTILVIHHLRKSEADDIMDTFSGTFGLTGAADGLLALNRKTGQSDATLSIIGRDVDAKEYALKFDPQLLTWNLIGEASEVKKSNERQVIYDLIKNSDNPLGPKEITNATGIKYRTVTNGLFKLIEDGSIIKSSSYGKYESPIQEYMESM